MRSPDREAPERCSLLDGRSRVPAYDQRRPATASFTVLAPPSGTGVDGPTVHRLEEGDEVEARAEIACCILIELFAAFLPQARVDAIPTRAPAFDILPRARHERILANVGRVGERTAYGDRIRGRSRILCGSDLSDETAKTQPRPDEGAVEIYRRVERRAATAAATTASFPGSPVPWCPTRPPRSSASPRTWSRRRATRGRRGSYGSASTPSSAP